MTSDSLTHFADKLRFETDPTDLAVAMKSAGPGLVVVDSRSAAAWDQGRIPGALHLPTARIAAEAAGLIPEGRNVVVYCWGPGCNGGTKAAVEFARLGYPVREMIGGFEYWLREGFPFETDAGVERREPDPLTAPRRVVPRTTTA